MACEWEDNVKYLVKHVENAEELSLLGFYGTGSRLDLDRMTVWNLQSGFLWSAVKVRRQVMDPQRVQLLSVKPHQQSSNEGIEKRKWKTSMVLPKWGKGLAQEVWCKPDASPSPPPREEIRVWFQGKVYPSAAAPHARGGVVDAERVWGDVGKQGQGLPVQHRVLGSSSQGICWRWRASGYWATPAPFAQTAFPLRLIVIQLFYIRHSFWAYKCDEKQI